MTSSKKRLNRLARYTRRHHEIYSANHQYDGMEVIEILWLAMRTASRICGPLSTDDILAMRMASDLASGEIG